MGRHRGGSGWRTKRAQIRQRKAGNRDGRNEVQQPKEPRKVGGEYYDGYWQMNYVVLEMQSPWLTVRWQNGDVRTHMVAWDYLADTIVREPGE